MACRKYYDGLCLGGDCEHCKENPFIEVTCCNKSLKRTLTGTPKCSVCGRIFTQSENSRANKRAAKKRMKNAMKQLKSIKRG